MARKKIKKISHNRKNIKQSNLEENPTECIDKQRYRTLWSEDDKNLIKILNSKKSKEKNETPPKQPKKAQGGESKLMKALFKKLEASIKRNELNSIPERPSKLVTVLLDRTISDERIKRTYCDLSKGIVANYNYKFLLINLLEHSSYIEEWKSFPREYLADEYFIRKMVSFGLGFYSIFSQISFSVWKNQPFIIELLKSSKGRIFKYFPKAVQKFPTYAELAVKLDETNMNYTPLNSDRVFVKTMLKGNLKCFPHISKELLLDQNFIVSLMVEFNIKHVDFFKKKDY